MIDRSSNSNFETNIESESLIVLRGGSDRAVLDYADTRSKGDDDECERGGLKMGAKQDDINM